MGVVSPAYISLQAISAGHEPVSIQYWIAITMAMTLEHLVDSTLFWLPLYYELKVCVFMYLTHPATRGWKLLFRATRDLYTSHNGAAKEISGKLNKVVEKWLLYLRMRFATYVKKLVLESLTGEIDSTLSTLAPDASIKKITDFEESQESVYKSSVIDAVSPTMSDQPAKVRRRRSRAAETTPSHALPPLDGRKQI